MSTTAEAPSLAALSTADLKIALAKLEEAIGGSLGLEVVCRVAEKEPLRGGAIASTLDGERPTTIVCDSRLVARFADRLDELSEEEIAAAIGAAGLPDALSDPVESLFDRLAAAIAEQASEEGSAKRGRSAELDEKARESFLRRAADEAVLFAAVVESDGAELGRLWIAEGEPTPAGSVRSASLPRSSDVDGWSVELHGWPGDPLREHVEGMIERLGARLLPHAPSGEEAAAADAALIVTRSAADLQIRLEKLSATGDRPGVVVACSDRPTLQLVSVARKHGANDFLVLPASEATLLAALTRHVSDD